MDDILSENFANDFPHYLGCCCVVTNIKMNGMITSCTLKWWVPY